MAVPERSSSGATPFRILDLGWRLGTTGVRSGALRSDTFPNFRHRVVGGVSGGTQEHSDCNDSCSDYDTCLIAISAFLNKKDLRLLLFLLGAVSACPIQFG